MSILRLKPACKDYTWGGQRLTDEFGIDYDKNILAEAWLLSTHKDGTSTLESGETLTDYIKRHGVEVLGTNCRRFKDCPLIIKFIDAKENLSVQVHPPDDYSLAHEGQLGKQEAWYVLDADEGSLLYCGFKQTITRDEFIARIKDNSLIEVLNAIPAHKGDVIFIPPGTVHAIGKGILTAEIQTNSNVTYRIYDYGRGRPLHIAQALDVTNLKPVNVRPENSQHVVACDYFVVDKLMLDGTETRGVVDDKTFLSVLILDGNGKISCGDEELTYCKGDSFLLTANSGAWTIKGTCYALLTRVPPL